MRKFIFILMILILSCNDAILEYEWDCGCDWEHEYEPAVAPDSPFSWRNDIPSLRASASTHKQMSALDMERIFREDMEDDARGAPPRFGYPHRVHYNLENAGEWITLPDGSRLWRLTISSPDALAIGLLYDQFWLPDGAKLWVYSTDRSHSTHAITSIYNIGTRDDIQGFASGLVYGDHITLEYFLPSYASETGIISVAYVVHGYRHIRLPVGIATRDARGFGMSLPCHINVNCPDGRNVRNERHAVVRIMMGYRSCTGFLVNTTANDRRLLLITADHCVVCASDAKYNHSPILPFWRFYWHFESPGCENRPPPVGLTTVGARLIANNRHLDFALLDLSVSGSQLRNHPHIAPYFLGWDRSGNLPRPGEEWVGIHHPAGDIKKISTSSRIANISGPVTWERPLQGGGVRIERFPADALWGVTWDQGRGLLQGGSSGSPLINSSRRITGIAFSVIRGHDNCTVRNPEARYSRFDVAWYGGINNGRRVRNDTIQRRLGYWLAPGREANAPLTINGLNSPVISATISGPNAVCSGTQPAEFTIQGLPANATVSWWTGNFLAIEGANNQRTVRVRPANPPTSIDSRVVAEVNVDGWLSRVDRELVVNRPTIHSFTSSSTSLHPGSTSLFTANHNGTSLTWSVIPNTGVHIWGSNNTRQITFNNPGHYTVSVTSANACGSDTRHLNVHVMGNQFICQCWRIPCICDIWQPPVLLGEEEEEVENE